MTEKRLLTSNEAAKYLASSPRTLETWRARGQGPPYIAFNSRAVRYRLEDLEEWVKNRLRKSTADAWAKAQV